MHYLKDPLKGFVLPFLLTLIVSANGSAQFRGDARLLSRQDVDRDIGLTSEQEQRVRVIEKQVSDETSRILNRHPKVSPIDPYEAIRPLWDKASANIQQQLNPSQRYRLAQIGIQLDGARCLWRDDVLANLKLSKSQLHGLALLNAACIGRERKSEARRRAGKLSAAELDRERSQSEVEFNTRAEQLLTHTQLKMLSKIRGRPFHATEEPKPPIWTFKEAETIQSDLEY